MRRCLPGLPQAVLLTMPRLHAQNAITHRPCMLSVQPTEGAFLVSCVAKSLHFPDLGFLTHEMGVKLPPPKVVGRIK